MHISHEISHAVTGIFLVTDTLWSHAARIREVLLYSPTQIASCCKCMDISSFNYDHLSE